jgi:hypothetical protein
MPQLKRTAGRKAPPGAEDHGVDAVRDRRPLYRAVGRSWLSFLIAQNLVYPHSARGNPHVVGHGHHGAHRGHHVPDVAGRADRQARHRQRRVDDHHGGHLGRECPAPSTGSIQLRTPAGRTRWVGWRSSLIAPASLVVVLAAVLMTVAQRRIPIQQAKHTRDARSSAGSALSAAARQPRRRHADHLRQLADDLPDAALSAGSTRWHRAPRGTGSLLGYLSTSSRTASIRQVPLRHPA